METKREALLQQFQHFLETASDASLDAVSACIQGAEQKDADLTHTYINGLLNYQGKLTESDGYKASITLNPFTLNTLNITHGGILATFADTVMGTHVFQLLPDNQAAVTSEMSIHFIAPALGEQLHASSEVVHRGNRLCVMDCKIKDDKGKLVATSTGSFFIIKRKN
ncbi:PaaI family thioesterase [Pullulanibacillus sp. KACC 23026]|uniref:PaaI family thioesterase n=1 Tax=Pullulanibacillus sp. KACC 23026 TaxID=3028315 RepID=UPI0023AFB3E2|nr:PaaI family thioesterase [Pullulanibacillus sp. KACC 23026]WEG11690.1 PaaI family thioesterase [Pullulanibacillus sp. KACC 23026]